MKKILAATGYKAINIAIGKFNNYEIINTINYKKDLFNACTNCMPDILLAGNMLQGNEYIEEILLEIKKHFADIRIIYLAGSIKEKDTNRIELITELIHEKIYDLILNDKITLAQIKDLLDNPKDKDFLSDFINKYNIKIEEKEEIVNKTLSENKIILSNKSNIIIDEPILKDEKIDEDAYKNLHVISSIKPGTGKSFLSVNLAAAVAAYGIPNKEGKRPNIALIEGDLQNLSIGTLLQIEDDKKNLKTAVKKMDKVLTSEGDFIGDINTTEEVNNFIMECFLPYKRIPNLKALVGSQLSFYEIENIKDYHYIYLIDAIVDKFDAIIVDTNSSITHVSTFPLLKKANKCYYILNLDFNNVRNNVRYRDMLFEMGISHKVRYILNEDISNNKNNIDVEDLMFTSEHLEKAGFGLDAKIPLVSKSVFLNKIYEGVPIVLDNKKYTEEVKFELLKAANKIYPIKNFDEMEKKLNKRMFR